eukprot:CAMPEP_0117442368 /NCGR_PEP_ID=MMETSP0759-20121206/4113_1 /TAXON_ID=63605 /ORGANISM="Percolomonas cosmopolitus, Strain WS" /LENGTH=269 /DNA_ID=CAMNT_0005234249 /DNA_START=170 /DNA_END=979 /DNA_ORIENTATION=+
MSAILSLATSLISQTNPIILALCVIFISFASYLFLFSSGNEMSSSSDSSVYEEKSLSLSQLMHELKVISRKEVAQHNDETNCWVIIDNFVYDLTPFIPRHPGGMSVLKARAGQDCTMGFHGFQHPENAYTNLKDYLIGRLPKEEFVRWIDESDVSEHRDEWYEFKGEIYRKPVSSTQERKQHAADFVGYLRRPIPIEMVHTHDQEKDCWIIIDGKIYDVTHWALEHPGGSIIISKPGEDVSQEFESFHADKDTVRKIMERYYVAPVLVK